MDIGEVLALPEDKTQTTLYVKLKEQHGCGFLRYEISPAEVMVQSPSATASSSSSAPWWHTSHKKQVITFTISFNGQSDWSLTTSLSNSRCQREKWQEQVPKVSLPEGQLVRDQEEATWNDDGSVLSWGPTNPTSRLVATVKQTPQPLSSPQAWADSRALLTWIFKPLSTIRRGTLSDGEVTKFSGSGRNAVVPEHTSCGINPLLPQLTSSTQWHCLTFILDLGSQGNPTCDTKLRGGNNCTNTHMHTKCCRTILCQVSVVDVRSCLWLRHGKVLYSSATLIAVKSIRDFHQLSPLPFEC